MRPTFPLSTLPTVVLRWAPGSSFWTRCWSGGANAGCKGAGGLSDMQILLASPRGFCAGVDRAIDIVERAIELFGAPIYVRHEVVHNRHVVERLRDLGARFVEELDEIPDGATVIFSAHGVSSSVEQEAARRGFKVFDATCPLVTKVHLEVARYARDARDVVLIGHAGHPEVEGTMGRFDASFGGAIHLVENVDDARQLRCSGPRPWPSSRRRRCRWMTRRRLSMCCASAFPQLQAPRIEDICYATQNRQDAVKRLLTECDVLVVVGSTSQFQFQPAARAGRSLRHSGLPGGWPGEPAARMVRRPQGGGRHGRGFRAGTAGAAGRGAADRLGRAGAARRSSGAKRMWCSACPSRCGPR